MACAVARLVPEKGLHDLIDAFNQSKINKKLVIVGSADHEDTYSKKLKSNASDNVIFAGRREGQALQALYKFANLFVLRNNLNDFKFVDALLLLLPAVGVALFMNSTEIFCLFIFFHFYPSAT